MNVFKRDLVLREVVVCEDGTLWKVSGGQGMKSAGVGRAVYAYPIDPVTTDHIGEMARIDADISVEQTNEYHVI